MRKRLLPILLLFLFGALPPGLGMESPAAVLAAAPPGGPVSGTVAESRVGEAPLESQCLEEEEREVYSREAEKLLVRIHEYFKVLSAPGTTHPPRVDAIRRRLDKYLGSLEEDDYISYEGVFLDENLEVQRKTTSVGEYIRRLESYRKDQAGLVNVCWGVSDEPIKLEFTRAKDQWGRINGRIPRWAEHTKENRPRDFYCVYAGEGYIREEVTFFKNNLIRRHVVCKKMSFYLRYLESKDDDGQATYSWRVYIAKITDSEKGECGNIKTEECPPPPGVCDSSIVYKPAPAWTYLVPGKGWDHFAAKKRAVRPWYFITGATATGLGFGLVRKIERDRHYDDHQNATTLKVLDEKYRKANNKHHEYLIYTGAALLIWGVNDILIYRKDRKQKRIFRSRFGCEEGQSAPPPEEKPDVSMRLSPRVIPPDGQLEHFSLGFTYQLNF